MAKQIVTLCIDDANVRLLVTRGKRIKKWAELPLDLGLTKVNVAVKEAEVAARIKQLLKSQKVRAKKVILGLSGLHCLTRPLTLPQLPRAMLEEAVMREAKRVLPVPLEQLYISWQTISATEKEIRVFLVAIPCNTADALLKMLRQVGLKPYLMDLKPLALARVVKETTAVIVDVQPTEFDIVIMADGIPQPVRTLSFPSEALPLSKKLSMIKKDLNRTIEFYNSNNPEKPLAPDVNIFVSGELADEPELCKRLSNDVGHPVLPMQSPLKQPLLMNPTHYMMNIGLALKELAKEAGPSVATLNALPTPYRPKPISLARIVAVPAAVTAIGLLAVLLMLIQDASASVDSMSNCLDTANHLIKQKQTQKKELTEGIAKLEKMIAEAEASFNTFTAALGNIDRQGDMINGDLEVTVSSLLSTMSLTGISHNSGKLTIHGTSPSEAEVLSYARTLDASGRFSEVTVASIRKAECGKMDFTLVLKTGGQD